MTTRAVGGAPILPKPFAPAGAAQPVVPPKRPAHPAPLAPLSLPEGVTFPPLGKLGDVARSELLAHLAELGLSPSADVVGTIAAGELAKAQSIDPRVTAAEMTRATARAAKAGQMVPVAQQNLFGFTALRDAKLKLDAKLLDALARAALKPPDVGMPELRHAIKHGPEDGSIAWPRPKNDLELVAGLVRQMVMHGGSLQLQLDDARRAFLEKVLAEVGHPVSTAMGGAGGFCANLATALPNVTSHFYSQVPLHPDVAKAFSPAVRTVNGDGKLASAGASTSPKAESRTNYSLEYASDLRFTLLGKDDFCFEGQRKPLKVAGGSRVILGSPSSFVPGFGAVDRDAIPKLADHDLCFLVGAHYFTKASPEQAGAQAEALASSLKALAKKNPAMVRHFQYVVPKVAANEALVLGKLKGAFDSMSLNSVELPGLIERLHAAGRATRSAPPAPEKADAEKPAFLVEAADLARQSMGVGRFHVHGMLGDLLVLDAVKDPERQVLALLRARQLASMKNANPTGEIKSAADVWPVVPTVGGEGLAAVHAFADALAAKFPAFAADPEARAKVVERWYWRDPETSRTWFFVPSRNLHARTGGSVSTGDTIDAAALIYGLDSARVPKNQPQTIAGRFGR